MKILYAEDLRQIPKGNWNFSKCCCSFFWIRHDEGENTLLLTCAACNQPNIKLAIRPPLRPLHFHQRAGFKFEDGKILFHLVPEMDTVCYWHEFHTGKRRLMRLLPRERDDWLRWLWTVGSMGEAVAAMLKRLWL